MKRGIELIIIIYSMSIGDMDTMLMDYHSRSQDKPIKIRGFLKDNRYTVVVLITRRRDGVILVR